MPPLSDYRTLACGEMTASPVVQRLVLPMREMRRLFGARRADGGTVDDLVAPSTRTAAEALSNRLPLDHGLTVGRQVMPGQPLA